MTIVLFHTNLSDFDFVFAIGLGDKGLGGLQPPNVEHCAKIGLNRAEIGLRSAKIFINSGI